MMLALAVLSLSAPALAAVSLPQADSPSAWTKSYAWPARPVVVPVDLVPGSDGGVISVSLAWNVAVGQGVADIVVVALSANGDPVWNWDVPTPSDQWEGILQAQFVAAASDADGRLYLTYSLPMRSKLVAFDVDGSVRWQRNITEPNGVPRYHTTCIATTSTGGVRVGGASYVGTWPTAGLHAFDADGNEEWSRSVADASTPTATGLPHGILVTPNDASFLFGQSDQFGFYSFYETLHVYDRDGVFLNGSGGGSSQNSAYVHAGLDPNGDVVLIESGYASSFSSTSRIFNLHRFSAAGAFLSDTYLGDQLPERSPVRGVAVLANGDRLIAHSTGTPRLLRVTRDGAMLPPFTLAGTPAGEILAVQGMPDGGAVVTGLLDSPDRAFDARFDANGTATWLGDRAGTPRDLSPPEPFIGDSDVDIVVDDRGNTFASTRVAGPAGTGSTRVATAKLLDGQPIGTSYCGPAVVGSSGVPGVLEAFGSDTRSADNITLLASGLPSGTLAMMLTSPQQGFVAQPGGSLGVLCLGGTIGRYISDGQIRRANSAGRTSLQIDLDVLPRPNTLYSANAGQTWNFQTWFRDVSGGVATSNFTQGIAISLQ